MGQNVRRLLEMEKDGIATGGPCVGRIVRIETNGDVLVDFIGNRLGPIRARVATTDELKGADQPVLLVFENGDAGLPLLAGVVREGRRRLELKGSVALEAAGEITITCGKSSITLRSDGRVVIKGTEIISRASGTNKIRGAAVKIN